MWRIFTQRGEQGRRRRRTLHNKLTNEEGNQEGIVWACIVAYELNSCLIAVCMLYEICDNWPNWWQWSLYAVMTESFFVSTDSIPVTTASWPSYKWQNPRINLTTTTTQHTNNKQ